MLVFLSPRRKVARVVSPLVEIETIFPEQGRAAFQATACACVSRCVVIPACTTSAPGANNRAAPSLSPEFSSWLQARTTLSGDGELDPQPARAATQISPSASLSLKTTRLISRA